MKIVQVHNLIKIFKKGVGHETITALGGVSFELEQGKVLGVIGPNGSGKSTLFKCILGFIQPKSGTITLFENRYQGAGLKCRIGFLYEKTNFYPELTPRELMTFYGKLYHLDPPTIQFRTKEYLNLVELSAFTDMKIRGFSKGMVQRLGIAMSLINESELLIFDELISGLDPFGAHKISGILQKLIERGKTIIMSSHVLSHIEDLCDDIIVLYKGKLLKSGSLEDFLTTRDRARIEIGVNGKDDIEKASNLLRDHGFQVAKSDLSSQDLENIFISLIGEQKANEV